MSHFHEQQYNRPFSRKRNQEILQNLEMRCLLKATVATDPAEVLRWRVQANALYKKNLSLGGSPRKREEAAMNKWLEAEESCRVTNARFRSLVSGGFPERSTLLFSVQRKIARILGPAPTLGELAPSFGPGSNVGCTKNTNARSKLAARATVSANAAAYVSAVAGSHPWWPLDPTEVAYGKLTFVPKTAEIDRPIVVEPILNTYLQKGCGDWIRRRLKRAGCDLDSQETNRNLARFASITGVLATVDLSSASDTLAKAVVEEVLPYDWWSLLSSFRTATVTYRGEPIQLQKFSSMGNGFTFELESLIFFAIAKSVCENSQFVSVYGDDIIVPTRACDALYDALQFFGFIVNNEKSFSSGPFRESCGKDYYLGVDVRPVYVKEALSVRQLFRLHNFFKRNYDEETAEMVLGYIPRGYHVYRGPDGYGDGHLIGDYHTIRRNRKHGWALRCFRTFQSEPRMYGDKRGVHSAILYLNSKTSERLPWHSFATSWTQVSESPPINAMLFTERGGERWTLKPVDVFE